MAGPGPGSRRYVIVGPGAVGGAVAARLSQQGHAVVLVARGPRAGYAEAVRSLACESLRVIKVNSLDGIRILARRN